MTDGVVTTDPAAQAHQLSSDILADLQQAVAAPTPSPAPAQEPDVAAQINAIKDAYLAQHEQRKQQAQKPDVEAQIDQIKAGIQ